MYRDERNFDVGMERKTLSGFEFSNWPLLAGERGFRSQWPEQGGTTTLAILGKKSQASEKIKSGPTLRIEAPQTTVARC